MDSKDFLNNLISKFDDGNVEIANIGFEEENNYFLKVLSSGSQKKIICVSSSYFNKNLNTLASIDNIYDIEAIISLPIFNDNDNLILIIFNSFKSNNECLFIDESDSLLHRDDSVDWSYAGEELISKITKTYKQFNENDTSIILNLDDIFKEYSSPKESSDGFKRKDKIISDKMSEELLSLKSDSDETTMRKHRIISDELSSLQIKSTDFTAKKHKVISDEISDGLLALKQKQSLDDEISKHSVKSNERSQGGNLPFLNDLMYSRKRQDPRNLLYKNNKPLIDGEVQFKKLGKIVDLHNIYFKNDNDSILIATCKGCKSKWVFHNKEINDFEGEVYIELINIDDKVSVEYLYEYLSSSNGFDELVYFSKGNNFITPDEIKNIKIPIPPLEIQKEIVSVARESREFFKSVELLKKEFNSNILDYKHMKNSIRELKGNITFDSETNEITSLSRSWRHAYKGLIWPLAISYLLATKGGFETVEKKDNYLVLFEFIAAFNSIVLLSGLPDDVYQNNFSRIWNSRNPNEYKQMTFANWVYLSKNLSDVYNNNNFTSMLDEDFFDKITDDTINNILEYAKNLRNDEAHGSHSNAFEAKEIIEKLDVYLDDIFDILEVYSNYKLIYVTGDIQSAKQAYSHRVILLNGPCAQPIYDNIIFNNILERECLYLYNPKNNKKLKLRDNLIKFMPIDKNKKRWALFLYYSCDKYENNAFYKCFQSNENNLKFPISSLKEDILL